MKIVIGAVIILIFTGITCFIKDDGTKSGNPEPKQNNIHDKPLTIKSYPAVTHLEGKTESCMPETKSILANKMMNFWIY